MPPNTIPNVRLKKTDTSPIDSEILAPYNDARKHIAPQAVGPQDQ